MTNKNPMVDPATATLLASIIARSIKRYTAKSPQVNLSSDSAVAHMSQAIAVDMEGAISALASQLGAFGASPTRPSNANKRAAAAYKKNQKDPYPAYDSSDDQHPETD